MFWNPDGLKALWYTAFDRAISDFSECRRKDPSAPNKSRKIASYIKCHLILTSYLITPSRNVLKMSRLTFLRMSHWGCGKKKKEKENVVNNTVHNNMFVTTEIQSLPIFPLVQALEFGNFTLSFWQTWSKYCQVPARATHLHVRRTCTCIFRRKKVAKQARSKHKLGSFSINDGNGNDKAMN